MKQDTSDDLHWTLKENTSRKIVNRISTIIIQMCTESAGQDQELVLASGWKKKHLINPSITEAHFTRNIYIYIYICVRIICSYVIKEKDSYVY
jgi:hypothetical protein